MARKRNRRSEAAKAAWVRRRVREQAQAAARAAAARKGWDTRRERIAQREWARAERKAKRDAAKRHKAAGALLPVGAELELTATTRGGTPRRDNRAGRRTDPAILAIKVYGVVHTPMSFEDASRMLHLAVLNDVWDARKLTVEVIDWMKGRKRSGQYSTPKDIEDALIVFRHALKQADVRVALTDRWKDLAR